MVKGKGDEQSDFTLIHQFWVKIFADNYSSFLFIIRLKFRLKLKPNVRPNLRKKILKKQRNIKKTNTLK